MNELASQTSLKGHSRHDSQQFLSHTHHSADVSFPHFQNHSTLCKWNGPGTAIICTGTDGAIDRHWRLELCLTPLSHDRDSERLATGWTVRGSVQTGPGAHPDSCTMGTVSFAKVKRPGRSLDHPSSAEVKEGVKLYLFSPSGPLWPVLG